ncbi:MAG: hypothetical protein LUI12_01745 [Clostridiales bacterium]|nr:hypothetical protein [Clostridiales bacterium]
MQKDEYNEIFEELGFEEAEEEVTATKEFMDFEETLDKPDKDIPMYEWILMSCHAGKGLAEAVRAVNDAYKLGYMTGKGATADRIIAHFENGKAVR